MKPEPAKATPKSAPRSKWIKNVINQVEELDQVIQSYLKELSRHDIPTIVKNLGEKFEAHVRANPYQALATACGIGFGLGALQRAPVKRIFFHLGKLAALGALSQIKQSQKRSTI